MKRYRVITDLRGLSRLQGRRPVLSFLWRDIATGCCRAALERTASRMEQDA
ncbi:MAG: hypothetical protein ACRCXD_03005 [Luteolibacter sp.]